MPVTFKGSSSGGITVQATAVAGANTLTLPAKTGNVITSADTGTVTQTMLASNVGATGPAFSAYASASQTVTLNTLTKVAIDTEEFDTNNNFDPTTNYRFTPTVAGYYQVNISLRGQVATTYTQCVAYLYKNGSEYKRFSFNGTFGTNTAFTATGNIIMYLNGSTDYIEFYGIVNGTGTAQFNATGSTQSSFFSAALVRGA